MKIDLKEVKTAVFGIQGSGKTYLVEHYLVNQFKNPVVYLIHQEDFKTCKNNVNIYVPKTQDGRIDTSTEHLNNFLGQILPLMKSGKIDALIVDEADLFFPKDFRNLQKYKNIHDFIINHRHYGRGKGTALIYMSRRPQDITTNIVETSEHVFLFAIQGKNIKDYMSSIHEDYKELIPYLKKQNHNFIYKRLGEDPKLMNKINVVVPTSSKNKSRKQ
jgi:hypothetical protein